MRIRGRHGVVVVELNAQAESFECGRDACEHRGISTRGAGAYAKDADPM